MSRSDFTLALLTMRPIVVQGSRIFFFEVNIMSVEKCNMNLESFPGTLPVHTTNEEVRKREDLLNAIDVRHQTILFGRYHLVSRSTNPSNIAFAISLFVPIANLLPT